LTSVTGGGISSSPRLCATRSKRQTKEESQGTKYRRNTLKIQYRNRRNKEKKNRRKTNPKHYTSKD
jgi:hypothetical protein